MSAVHERGLGGVRKKTQISRASYKDLVEIACVAVATSLRPPTPTCLRRQPLVAHAIMLSGAVASAWLVTTSLSILASISMSTLASVSMVTRASDASGAAHRLGIPQGNGTTKLVQTSRPRLHTWDSPDSGYKPLCARAPTCLPARPSGNQVAEVTVVRQKSRTPVLADRPAGIQCAARFAPWGSGVRWLCLAR